MFERPSSAERAVLVHVNFRHLFEQADLHEFSELTLAAGITPVATVTGLRDKPDPKYYVGKGKLEEILQVITLNDATLVIFNHELTPSQERNVQRYVKCRVMSRTGLILDIFAQRARTFEGKLQVELAQLEHMSTRLVRIWTHLERQKGGIGLRGGPGETQLEVDRRLIRARILTIEKRLEKVRSQRQQGRNARQRAQVPTIALVGYTNAGKSTLFNTLTGADVWVANQLFATLDPTLRSLEVAGLGKIVIADTVGFIRQLPHTLVDAFRATLEETATASLLIHVVDASDEKYEDNIHQVNQVLAEIGAETIPQLLVFNKADLLNDPAYHAGLAERDKDGKITKLWVSALKGIGLDLLREALQGRLSIDRVHGVLHLTPEQGQLRAQLYAFRVVIQDIANAEGGWDLVINLTKFQWDKLCQQYAGLSQAFSAL
ncbi:MAG: GTPase HflX [Gammaproteobacteria bacterium 39-13]|nr:GTPase HflX [Gammaproteobacteria bacterium]OJV88113.1 MAG: GTPase HflX [Gammaproteobacteria bacterium 39-13]